MKSKRLFIFRYLLNSNIEINIMAYSYESAIEMLEYTFELNDFVLVN